MRGSPIDTRIWDVLLIPHPEAWFSQHFESSIVIRGEKLNMNNDLRSRKKREGGDCKKRVFGRSLEGRFLRTMRVMYD